VRHCPRCSTANEDARLRCLACGATLGTHDRDTRKLNRNDVLKAIALSVEKPGPQAPKPPPPPPPPRIPPPPPTVLVDWAPEGALSSSVLDMPYPLQRTSVVTIGRTDENNIVMPVHQVSRRHALVKWDGEGFAIVDQRSTNGTFVNGEPVQRRRLAEGDKIGIGPFELVFTSGRGDLTSSRDTSTVVVAIPGAFSGELEQVSMPEICQLIEINRKTGVLSLQDGDRRGKLFFTEGRAIHAEYRDHLGDEAALELLSCAKGSFRFYAREHANIQATIKRPTTVLLMEAARRADEKR